MNFPWPYNFFLSVLCFFIDSCYSNLCLHRIVTTASLKMQQTSRERAREVWNTRENLLKDIKLQKSHKSWESLITEELCHSDWKKMSEIWWLNGTRDWGMKSWETGWMKGGGTARRSRRRLTERQMVARLVSRWLLTVAYLSWAEFTHTEDLKNTSHCATNNSFLCQQAIQQRCINWNRNVLVELNVPITAKFAFSIIVCSFVALYEALMVNWLLRKILEVKDFKETMTEFDYIPFASQRGHVVAAVQESRGRFWEANCEDRNLNKDTYESAVPS